MVSRIKVIKDVEGTKTGSWRRYKVVQIWPGLIVCKQVTVRPGHISTTLYLELSGKHMGGRRGKFHSEKTFIIRVAHWKLYDLETVVRYPARATDFTLRLKAFAAIVMLYKGFWVLTRQVETPKTFTQQVLFSSKRLDPPTASNSVDTGDYLLGGGGQSGRSVKLNIHLHAMSSLGINGDMPPLPRILSWPAHKEV